MKNYVNPVGKQTSYDYDVIHVSEAGGEWVKTANAVEILEKAGKLDCVMRGN